MGLKTFGLMAVDWEERVDFERLRRERLERAKKLFGAEHANVQPHSGSQANLTVYQAMLEPGDIVLDPFLGSGTTASSTTRSATPSRSTGSRPSESFIRGA